MKDEVIIKKHIEEAVLNHTGEQVKNFYKLTTGLFNDTYIVKFAEHVEYINSKEVNKDEIIIRIAPPDTQGLLFYEKDMMVQEPRIHEILLVKTNLPVPIIYLHDRSKKFIPREYLMMEKLPGIAMSQARWLNNTTRDKILNELGGYLKQVHKITDTQYGYVGKHHPMIPQDSWWKAFKIIWNKLIDDVRDTGVYTEKETIKFKKLLLQNKSAFLERENIPSSLLHMDLWAQNILINSESIITGIVDWDRALWGDPEIEFSVLTYCGISQSSFWKGYGMQREETINSRIRDLFYLLYEHQKYIPINIWRRHNPLLAKKYKKDCIKLYSKIISLT